MVSLARPPDSRRPSDRRPQPRQSAPGRAGPYFLGRNLSHSVDPRQSGRWPNCRQRHFHPAGTSARHRRAERHCLDAGPGPLREPIPPPARIGTIPPARRLPSTPEREHFPVISDFRGFPAWVGKIRRLVEPTSAARTVRWLSWDSPDKSKDCGPAPPLANRRGRIGFVIVLPQRLPNSPQIIFAIIPCIPAPGSGGRTDLLAGGSRGVYPLRSPEREILGPQGLERFVAACTLRQTARKSRPTNRTLSNRESLESLAGLVTIEPSYTSQPLPAHSQNPRRAEKFLHFLIAVPAANVKNERTNQRSPYECC